MAPAVHVLVGALRPKVISSQATSCWHRKLRWRPTSVVHWPWRTNFLCQQADEICISITELVIDFIAPAERISHARVLHHQARLSISRRLSLTRAALNA